MNFIKRLVLIAPVALLSVNSCKNDNCNDPIAFNYDPEGTSEESCIYGPKTVEFTVHPVFAGEAFALGDTFKVDSGRTLTFTYFGVYLSNLSFKEGEEYKQWSDNVVLVRNEKAEMQTLYLNKAKITGFKFDVGVDTTIYNEDPSTLSEDNPLAFQVPTMYWPWAGGYRFITIEGKVDTSAAKDGSEMADFGFHCGLPANLKTVELSNEGISSTGESINVGLAMDVQKMLENVDFNNIDLVIHSGDHPVTVLIANNAMNAFTLQ